MARFYGIVDGRRGQASREGDTRSGVSTVCAAYAGAIRCQAYAKGDHDWVRVTRIPWHGSGGDTVVLYEGPLMLKREDVGPILINLGG
jgi:hypothetical protein